MTRPDAAADGSGEPAPDAGTLAAVLLLAARAASALAARARADVGRLGGGDAQGAATLTAEADAAAATASRLSTELAERGVDPDAAGAAPTPALRDWAGARPGRDAAEALVGARLARGLVVDLAVGLGGEEAAAHLAGLDDPLAGPAARLVADAVADRRTHDRLALVGRRVLGEALVLVEALLTDPAATPTAAGPAPGPGDGGRKALVKRIKSAHGRRVGALGL